jgi:phosphate transport system substrate-binding protein
MNAYPIMAASFVLIHKYPKDFGRSREALKFFQWALENGQDMAASLDYLPLAPQVVQEIERYWDVELNPVAKGSSSSRARSG